MNNSDRKIKVVILIKKIYADAREVDKRCEEGGSPRSKEESQHSAGGAACFEGVERGAMCFLAFGQELKKKKKGQGAVG